MLISPDHIFYRAIGFFDVFHALILMSVLQLLSYQITILDSLTGAIFDVAFPAMVFEPFLSILCGRSL